MRSVEKWVNKLLEEGLRRSPTLARLTAEIDASRAIVYVEPRDVLIAGIAGAVPSEMFQAPDGTRYLRVWVLRTLAHDEMIETIGHELQHVVELLEGGDVDQSPTTRNRDRETGRWMIETDAARTAGQAVHGELLVRARRERPRNRCVGS